MKKFSLFCLSLLITVSVQAQSLYPGQQRDKIKLQNVGAMRAEAFELGDVRLLPSRFRENMERDSAWIAQIAADRLLHSFRTTAGVFAGREGGYMTVKKLGGWESLDCELRGHTTGHLLSACALIYAQTGEDMFREKGDSLVRGLREVQLAHGNGYLSAYPEGLIDRNIAGKGVWAPWYTLHKIMSGLLDQYLHADNDMALETACDMADWAYNKLSGLDTATRHRMLRNEFGGMPEAFWNLYSITGNEHHRWLAEFFYHEAVIDPLRHEHSDFGTKHTNTFIPKVLAEARAWELTGLDSARRATVFFFDEMLHAGHTFAPGCLSDKEHFFDTKDFSRHISGYTGESCCTYNMLKLARHLFTWTASAEVSDYYERALYNHILGQQDPATGMLCYFLPLKTGTHKVYSTPDRSFWCCVGSGFESNAKYGEAIYYKSADTLYCNLMIPSRLSWREKGVTLTQTTCFPEEEVSTLTFEVVQPASATLRLRHPAWCSQPEVKVNGRKVRARSSENGWLDVRRTWRNGDRVEVRYPMSLRTELSPDGKNAALFYGPVLMAARLGTDGFTAPQPDSDPAKYNDYYTYDYNIPDSAANIDVDPAALTRVEETLRFRTPDGVEFAPLYDIHRERYGVYFPCK